MDIDLIDHDLRRCGARQLVVVLHGFRRSHTDMDGVAATINATLPDADIFMPDLPTRRWHSTVQAEAITAALVAGIDQRVAAHGYASIILVGHSLGGLLARKVFLAAWGSAGDVVDARGQPLVRRDWAERIVRIVFLAAVNRGWTVSSALGYAASMVWRAGSLVNNLAFRGRATICQSRRGAPFLVATRLQWLALVNDLSLAARRVKVVQLVGTVDDFVSPDDAVDHVADFSDGDAKPASRRFFLLEVPATGHADAIEIADTDDPAQAPIRRERRELLALALSGTAVELDAHRRAIRREYLYDTLPPAPDRKVADVVFVIHGIRDHGFWTRKIARKIREFADAREDASRRKVRCVTVTYGYFPMAPFILRWGRREKVEWFMDLYCETKARFPDAAFSYVGHSNGTYLLASALRDYPLTRFESVVFAGSVVRRDFPWAQFRAPAAAGGASRVARVLNYVATKDWVVAVFPKGLQPFRLFDLGSAGHDGFAGVHGDAEIHQVTYIKGSHGAGIKESQWDDIARFVLGGDLPPRDDPDMARRQEPSARFLGSISTMIVTCLAAVVIALGVLPLVLLARWHEGTWLDALLLAAFAAYWALVRTVVTRV